MTTTTTPHQSASLHYREGNSDKVYHAAIEPEGDGYLVTFSYGRRGSMLQTGTKTTRPVPLEEARQIYEKLVKSKLAKGYQPTGGKQVTPTYRQESGVGRDTGIRCQLLNPVDEHDVSLLLRDQRHCLQEKHDGHRLMIRKCSGTVTGINRRGFVVAIPEAIRGFVAGRLCDVLIDGEAVGGVLHVFDLLEFDGTDIRRLGYLERFRILQGLVPTGSRLLRVVGSAITPSEKLERYGEIRTANREGVVFKDIHAPYSPGRPNSGGPQLKFKFVESASFLVTGINRKRSVTLGLLDGSGWRCAGNVSIPPNHPVPEVGEVCEVRYLYAYRQSGRIYQPVYVGKRTDIPPADCTVGQLKFKAD